MDICLFVSLSVTLCFGDICIWKEIPALRRRRGVGGSGDRCVGLHMGGSFAEVGCLHGADYYHQAAGAMDESVE